MIGKWLDVTSRIAIGCSILLVCFPVNRLEADTLDRALAGLESCQTEHSIARELKRCEGRFLLMAASGGGNCRKQKYRERNWQRSRIKLENNVIILGNKAFNLFWSVGKSLHPRTAKLVDRVVDAGNKRIQKMTTLNQQLDIQKEREALLRLKAQAAFEACKAKELQKRIKALQKKVVRAAKNYQEPAGCKRIVGIWDWFTGGIVRIKSDHSIYTIEPSLGVMTGQWECLSVTTKEFRLTWSWQGLTFVDDLHLSSNAYNLSGTNQEGTLISGARRETGGICLLCFSDCFDDNKCRVGIGQCEENCRRLCC